MDHSQSGIHSERLDSEWDSRVERAATADVRGMLRHARRHRRERWLIGSIGLVAVALVLVLFTRIGLFDGLLPGADSPAATATAGTEPSEAVSLVLDLNRPFAGSPAASWADGAAGIVPPPAGAVGGFAAEQVATAMSQVRDILVASRLDRLVVVEHDPAPFLGAFAPDASRPLRPLFGTGQESRVQSLVSLVAEGSRLLPVEPKVTGRMSASAGDVPGELVVHTNYLFVYAFDTDRPDRIADPMDILVVVRAEVDYVLRRGDRWTLGSQGWWYDRTGGYAYSIACDAYRGGFLAPAFTEHAAAPSGQDRAAYFDLDRSLPAASGCPR